MTTAEKRLLALTLGALTGVFSSSAIVKGLQLQGPIVALPFFLAIAFLGFAAALVQEMWQRRR